MASPSYSKDYETCCRTCLNDGFLKMHDIFFKIDESTTVAEVLMSCTAIKVEKEDNLPKTLCGSCYNCLISFNDFRKLAENVDVKLRNQISEESYKFHITLENIDAPVNIKSELENGEYQCDNNELQQDIKQELNLNDDYDDDDDYKPDFDFNESSDDSKYKFKCQICYKKYKTETRFQQHLEKHNVKSDTQYTCKICSKSFKRHFRYRKHLLNHENLPEINQNELGKIQCEVCAVNFKTANSLAAHMRKHTKKNRVLACSICGKVFNKVSHVKRHELCHEENRPFICNLCPKRFNTEALLTEHINSRHNKVKNHICPVCNKSFAHMSTFSNHVKIHTRDKPYLCPTCGKKFSATTNLNQHMRRHLGLKVFACNLCPRKFVSKGELVSHGVTHSGERAWRCALCGARFTKASSLRLHSRRHAGQRPHHCDTCPKQFTTKDHLKRHYLTHTGEKPFKCDMCERAFTQSNDLVKHKRSHLGDKLYKCTECPQSFRLQTELRQHISDHYISHQLRTREKPTEGVSHQIQPIDDADIKVNGIESSGTEPIIS